MNDEQRNPDRPDDTIASPRENAKLDHSQSGTTTRDDQLDAGVPMLQGDAKEPVGPEDALGAGAKRGDYGDRVERTGQHFESQPIDGGGEPVTQWVDEKSGAKAKEGDKGAVEVQVDRAPTSELVPQNPRTADIGDEPGKGGVTTGGQATPLA